jgi:archaellum biogenesis protein FlaJ (TadC family)
MMMKTLFYYCYYRISQAYRSFNDSDYLDSGYHVLFASFTFIVFSIAVPISSFGDKRLTKISFILLAAPFLFLYARTWFIPEKRKMDLFKRLEKRYKDEPHKKLKGWLVALYAVGTLVLFHIMCIIFVLK